MFPVMIRPVKDIMHDFTTIKLHDSIDIGSETLTTELGFDLGRLIAKAYVYNAYIQASSCPLVI